MLCSGLTAVIRTLALVFPTTRPPRDETKNTPTPTQGQTEGPRVGGTGDTSCGFLPEAPQGRESQAWPRCHPVYLPPAQCGVEQTSPTAAPTRGGTNQPDRSPNPRSAGSERMRGRLSAMVQSSTRL
uniref:Uncharacterized protein n=1 Tax=Rangifer tarandus platyrhynchus TaxID=3082113 RepID=A0ACB0FAW8_RANTA|nr:unnamed protein product [Rangifer tarandus platyrhynchus]